MIDKAFVQEVGNGQLREEEQKVVETLQNRDISITFYTEKKIRKRQLPLDKASLVVGDLPCIQGALKQLGIPEPTPNDYPKALQELMYRRVWYMTLGELTRLFQQSTHPPLFAKPAIRRKRFTGMVVESERDLFQLYWDITQRITYLFRGSKMAE